MRRRARKHSRRRTMRVLVTLLLLSAGVRFAAEAGPAIAEISGQAAEGVAPVTPPEDGFLAAIMAREAQLDAREAALEARIAAMEAAQETLDAKLAALEAAESSLLSTIATAETASASDVAQLTAVYENMKPKEAAALFAEMSPDFAAGFLALLRPDVAAAIMSELEPEIAHAFSVVLAGRNANTPTR